jgi:hypothetical protein
VSESEAKPKPSKAGMIPRRIEMPAGMWNEVLEVAKDGGLDHRDAVNVLIDLGLQAQDEGRFKPRLVPVDHELWTRVGQANLKGASDQDALVYLVDLGLQTRAANQAAEPLEDEAIPPDGTRLRADRLEDDGRLTRILETYVMAVPDQGDLVTILGQHYRIEQRAWTLGSIPTAYLRVRHYEGD